MPVVHGVEGAVDARAGSREIHGLEAVTRPAGQLEGGVDRRDRDDVIEVVGRRIVRMGAIVVSAVVASRGDE